MTHVRILIVSLDSKKSIASYHIALLQRQRFIFEIIKHQNLHGTVARILRHIIRLIRLRHHICSCSLLYNSQWVYLIINQNCNFRYARMSPERFQHLLSLVEPYLKKKFCRSRETISAAERLAVCLRYLATGDSQQSQMFNFRVGRATVCKIVKEVCHALWESLNRVYVKMPSSIEDWKSIADNYEQEWNFPNVLGAVDGKHIAIECPKFGGSLYYHYKNFHSLVLMAVCDSAYRFTYVDIGSYGCENDASILRRTELFKDFESQTVPVPQPRQIGEFLVPYTLLGDEIFPLNTWLMKPFPGKNLTHEQDVFNYRLSRARRTIENAFGVLSARWRIFRRPIRANVDTVQHIIKATIALHNYLLLTENACYIPSGFVDCWSANGELISGKWRGEVHTDDPALRELHRQGSANYRYSAKETREQLCRLVNSAEFVLDHQDELVRSCGTVID